MTTVQFVNREAEREVDSLFIQRYSSRKFANDQLDEQQIVTLIEAAKWAPSASNEQPWRFIIANDEKQKKLFSEFINEGNRTWVDQAPALILLLSKNIKDNGDVNSYHEFDSGTAWGYLSVQAHLQGLNTRAIGGFDKIKAKELLHLSDDLEPRIVIALGHKDAQEEQLTTRKSLEHLILSI